MVLVDVYVPFANQEFDFGLEEKARISEVTEEIAFLASRMGQRALRGDTASLVLCSMRDKAILPREKTLEQCGIQSGSRLMLV